VTQRTATWYLRTFISITGPLDSAFTEKAGLNPLLKMIMSLMSRGVLKKAKALGIRYSFLLMRAQGLHLSKITALIESGVIRPVVDKEFPFEKTMEALAYVETGHAKGKVVINVAE